MQATTLSQVAIFWDYENCRPPSNLSGSKLVDNIRNLVQGPGSITLFKAYVDVSFECTNARSIAFQSDLQSAGVTLVHCPHNGKKDVADKMMIVDMFAFALDRPPPATIVVITGDRDFAYAAAILKMRGYKITVIAPPNFGHASLKMQADCLYDWQRDINDVDISESIAPALDHSMPPSNEEPNGKDCRAGVWRPDPQSAVFVPTNFPNKSGYYSQANVAQQKVQTTADAVLADVKRSAEAPSRSFTTPVPVTLGSIHETTETDETPTAKASVLPNNSDESHPFSITLENFAGPQCMRSMIDEYSDDNADCHCYCAICSRSSGVIRSGSKGVADNVIEQKDGFISERAFPEQGQADDDLDSFVSSLSGRSLTVSSIDSKSSSDESSDVQKLFTRPSFVSITRFMTLIWYFREQVAIDGTSRIRSATVASEMRKRDPEVYEKAGVTKMKQFVEEARKANVIITPGLDNEGDGWIEINPCLYSTSSAALVQSKQPKTNLFIPRPAKTPKLAVDAIFKPLVQRLRMEKPTYRLLYSMLGTYFKTEYTELYKKADVLGLSSYLQKAEERGIVRICSPRGQHWAELMPAYRLPN